MKRNTRSSATSYTQSKTLMSFPYLNSVCDRHHEYITCRLGNIIFCLLYGPQLFRLINESLQFKNKEYRDINIIHKDDHTKLMKARARAQTHTHMRAHTCMPLNTQYIVFNFKDLCS